MSEVCAEAVVVLAVVLPAPALELVSLVLSLEVFLCSVGPSEAVAGACVELGLPELPPELESPELELDGLLCSVGRSGSETGSSSCAGAPELEPELAPELLPVPPPLPEPPRPSSPCLLRCKTGSSPCTSSSTWVRARFC